MEEHLNSSSTVDLWMSARKVVAVALSIAEVMCRVRDVWMNVLKIKFELGRETGNERTHTL